MAVLPFSPATAEEAPADVHWTAVINPDAKGVVVTCVVRGAKTSDIARMEVGRTLATVRPKVVKSESDLVLRYAVPIEQGVFEDVLKPVHNDGQFCAFGEHLVVTPVLKNRKFKRFSLTLECPKEWTLVTSLGTGTNTYTFENVGDLNGLMICAGDYTVKEFTLPNKNREDPTRYVLILHGERSFKDEDFFATMKKMMQAQLDYFGGDHPAPVQAIALHLVGKGVNPGIPGFNRRAPSFDSILGVHSPKRPWGSFEFFGMLSHEHMHNWFPNVLRSDLGPWFMEGLNDYVSYGIMFDSGLHSAAQTSGMLSKWFREYQWCLRQEKHPLMPYRQGMIAAWVMDLEIQRATGKKKSLKNLIEHLLENTPRDQAVSRKEFVAALEALIGAPAETLYARLIESDEAIPLAKYLEETRYSIEDGKIRIAN